MTIRSIRSLLFGLMLFAVVTLALSPASSAQIGVSITIGPPPLPVYEQPPCPAEGFIWTPGYWAYGDDGYYWVPGTWVEVPAVGLLWTPGYWGWGNGVYVWNAGYWGPQVGFYGGINYGYGYAGAGYEGGYWNNGRLYYNRTVNNVSTTNITNVYNKTVINNTTVNNVSYNGGPGGTSARPTPQEQAAANAKHTPPTAVQVQQQQAARTNRAQLASVNHGEPPVAATAKPGAFSGSGVVKASRAGAPYNPPTEHPASRPAENNQAARPENNRPENNRPENNRPENGASRPDTQQGVAPATRPEVPHPPTASKPESEPRMENQPHPQNAPRPENQPRPESPLHPETAPHPEVAPRPENNQHPEMAPPSKTERAPEQTRPEEPARPEKEPRPEQEKPPQ